MGTCCGVAYLYSGFVHRNVEHAAEQVHVRLQADLQGGGGQRGLGEEGLELVRPHRQQRVHPGHGLGVLQAGGGRRAVQLLYVLDPLVHHLQLALHAGHPLDAGHPAAGRLGEGAQLQLHDAGVGLLGGRLVQRREAQLQRVV